MLKKFKNACKIKGLHNVVNDFMILNIGDMWHLISVCISGIIAFCAFGISAYITAKITPFFFDTNDKWDNIFNLCLKILNYGLFVVYVVIGFIIFFIKLFASIRITKIEQDKNIEMYQNSTYGDSSCLPPGINEMAEELSKGVKEADKIEAIDDMEGNENEHKGSKN